jgi:hypothetical protein
VAAAEAENEGSTAKLVAAIAPAAMAAMLF